MDVTPIFPRERLLGPNGGMLTQGLFYEQRFMSEAEPVYSLKERDHKGCLSMQKIYMECATEYEAAMRLLGSWNHWKKLCNCAWFKPFIDAWREEHAIRDEALGKSVLILKATEGNVTAAKELIAGGQKKGTGAGRPKKKNEEAERLRSEAIDQKVVSLLSRVENV